MSITLETGKAGPASVRLEDPRFEITLFAETTNPIQVVDLRIAPTATGFD